MSDAPGYHAPDLTLVGEEHVRQYRATDGATGYLWNGVPTLLLTTRGRRSGRPHTTALIFGRDGEDYLVVASMGGAPSHPSWYRNLVADPQVEVQVRGETFGATATTADDDERARLWSVMTGLWPNYDSYQERTERRIPVVRLRRAGPS